MGFTHNIFGDCRFAGKSQPSGICLNKRRQISLACPFPTKVSFDYIILHVFINFICLFGFYMPCNILVYCDFLVAFKFLCSGAFSVIESHERNRPECLRFSLDSMTEYVPKYEYREFSKFTNSI